MGDGFASKAQRDHWKTLVESGKVTQEQFDAREKNTPAEIPHRATPRKRTVGPSRSFDAAKFGDQLY